MRLRAGHVVVALIVLITGFVAVVATRAPSGGADPDASLDATLPPAGSAPDDTAVIAIDMRDMDLGVIPRTEPGHGTLPVCNRGKRPLVIRDIQTSCACTRGELPPGKNVIPPGECADVRVTVYPNRIFGFKSVKTLTFMSNDPANPSVTVSVSATVDPEFSITPEELDFGAVEKGAEMRRTLRVATLTGEPVTVTAVSDRLPGEEAGPPGPWRYEIEKVPEAEWKTPGRPEWLVHVTLEGWAAPGPIAGAAFISTDIKRFPHFRVPVIGEVRAPYTLTADAAGGTLLIPPGKSAPVAVRSETPVSCGGAKAAGGGLDIAVVPDGDGLGFRCDISAKPDTPPGRQEDMLEIEIGAGGKTFHERMRARWFGSSVRPAAPAAPSGPPAAGG